MSGRPRARQLGVIGCHVCGLVCEDRLGERGHARCPCCHTALRRRRPDSIGRAWAFLLSGMVFYIPANALPVMYTGLLGSSSNNTILQGVISFWKDGSYGIALVIFVASVVVPCTKFLILGLLLVTSQRRSRWAKRERARLYCLIELVGYWSMLDVLVVATVAALVKFQALGDIEPRIGIFFFGAMVILTMLSALNFDPRLIWDGMATDE
ncbi:paraquat-inducible protein A [Rhodanobacter sp. MP1X3]|uniref:paraquat-inducible protein A n=1 Tax=Rhodanobacter sp. MP1X3 TaxID=2723086 RepID=UPI0016215248|nr:paraquat-inducible protein A [Rhodanobacter sp. MP1X3]MBB6242515.1 paraquat-inducible protein A [Rhodanobacter sp. MP1X3]